MAHCDLWQIEGDEACLTSARLSAHIALSHPEQGLRAIRYRGQAINQGPILQMSAVPPTANGETILEAYVRGHDVIVTYDQIPPRTARPQLYYRYVECPDEAAGCEILISVQTSLLASEPTVQATTTWDAPETEILIGNADVLTPADTAGQRISASTPLILFRPPRVDWSYCEMVFPADFIGGDVINSEQEWCLKYAFFLQGLEKGVIRRGRVRGLFLPRVGDERLARHQFDAFAQSDLPLTT
ncbi:MAG: hypothetical protein KDA60_09715 [Planctomycetales bacterium]|nr:hypothetical protein [Planctomycetales bacterium]